MKTLRVVIACGCLILSSSIAARAQSVQTDYDRTYNLAKLRTYSFAEQTRPPGDRFGGQSTKRSPNSLGAGLTTTDKRIPARRAAGFLDRLLCDHTHGSRY